MIDDSTITKLRELASKATPGPWRYHMGNVTQISDGGKGYPLDYYPDCADVVTTDEADAQIITNDDAEYIAAANPQTVIAILSALDRAKQLAREAVQAGQRLTVPAGTGTHREVAEQLAAISKELDQ